jgi:hypothetical protein
MNYTLDIHFSCRVPYLNADHQISASFKSFSICNMYMFNKTATLQEIIVLYVYRLCSCCSLWEVYVITLTFLYALRSLLSPKFMNLWTHCFHIVIVVHSSALTFANCSCELLHDQLPNGLLHLCISPYSVGYSSLFWYIYNDINWNWAHVNAW